MSERIVDHSTCAHSVGLCYEGRAVVSQSEFSRVVRRQELTRAEEVQLGAVLSSERREAMRRTNYITGSGLQVAIMEVAREIAAHPNDQHSHPTLAFDGSVGKSFYCFDPIEGCNVGSGDSDGDVRIADARAFIHWISNRDMVFSLPHCNEPQHCTKCGPGVLEAQLARLERNRAAGVRFESSSNDTDDWGA